MSVPARDTSVRRRTIGLICSVWGDEFTGFFCRYVIPTILARQNLPWLAEHHDVGLLLYTTAADLATMEEDPGFQEVKRLAAVRCVGIESFVAGARNHWAYWQHGVAEFKDDYEDFILLIPDCLYANDCLRRVATALETSKVVYYAVPQVCRELVVGQLERSTVRAPGDPAIRLLELSVRDLSEIFVRYINPKHAAAVRRPDFFLTHPEYVLDVGPGSVGIIEQISHPLALRSTLGSITQSFSAADERQDAAHLGLLGLGCEFTLKFIEQYYRWPAESMSASRFPSLGSWCHTFLDRGMTRYAHTQARVTLRGSEVVATERLPSTGRRNRYACIAHSVLQSQFAVFEFANAAGNADARRCIALAMCLPGLRRRIMELGELVTVLIPAPRDLTAMLGALEKAGSPGALVEFCLMHVLPGHLRLRRGETFRLWPADAASRRVQHVQLVSPAVPDPRMSVASGTVRSYAARVSAHAIVYEVDLDYGNVDAMLARLDRRPAAQRPH